MDEAHATALALAAFRAAPERFDLILTDEAMPDLIGTELASYFRRYRSDVPIILVSGHAGTQLARTATTIGVNKLLCKPLQRRELAEAVAQVLRAAHYSPNLS